VAAALAAGCSVILKGPEETPASCAALVQALADAGLPAGVLNLVFGVPAEISAYLIPHRTIRKVSFTGSVPVGKHLAALAGAHMKRVTMELGGHSPAIVFEDADVDVAAKILSANKFRNAGQICVSPTRFIVHEELYEPFVDRFVAAARAVKVGDGMTEGVAMGPLATARRVEAMEGFIADAIAKGAKLRTGGRRIGNTGYLCRRMPA
jgi:succinate-semialdehyde dehydrogenase/glutarate-semialdehyde dehydrogenase